MWSLASYNIIMGNESDMQKLAFNTLFLITVLTSLCKQPHILVHLKLLPYVKSVTVFLFPPSPSWSEPNFFLWLSEDLCNLGHKRCYPSVATWCPATGECLRHCHLELTFSRMFASMEIPHEDSTHPCYRTFPDGEWQSRTQILFLSSNFQTTNGTVIYETVTHQDPCIDFFNSSFF